MTDKHLLETLNISQAVLCLGVCWMMGRRCVAKIFPALFCFMLNVAADVVVRSALIFHARALHIPRTWVHPLFFYSQWTTQLIGICLLVMIIYGLFSEAMRPFPGLQRIGKIVFRWVGAVSFLFAMALSVTPELFTKGTSLWGIYNEVNPRFEQGIHVLVLCLLVFVCFAIQPLGLTFRSHLFGVVLGLGVYATVQLVEQAWYATGQATNVYSPLFIFDSAGSCAAVAIWLIYFGMPEPKRRMILLPTTSPFFLWNRISEILGDAPGNVAVAGFTPDMLAPAEIEMLSIAIAREEAAAEEREGSLSAGRSSGFPAPSLPAPYLPAPSEREFALLQR